MKDFNPTGDEAAVGKFLVLMVIPHDSECGDEHMFGVTIAVELLTNPNITHDPGTKMC